MNKLFQVVAIAVLELGFAFQVAAQSSVFDGEYRLTNWPPVQITVRASEREEVRQVIHMASEIVKKSLVAKGLVESMDREVHDLQLIHEGRKCYIEIAGNLYSTGAQASINFECRPANTYGNGITVAHSINPMTAGPKVLEEAAFSADIVGFLNGKLGQIEYYQIDKPLPLYSSFK